jgi:1-acyl-sn-glycerol-3-phosphate acyltransferase
VRLSSGGRTLERLAGPSKRPSGSGAPLRWRTRRAGSDPWSRSAPAPDQTWLRQPAGRAARNALQQSLLFPLARTIARPRVIGAEDLLSAPQPALLAPNHASDIDTPLILAALPHIWRSRTVVGAAADRFYRNHGYAILTALWINTFPFDRGGDLRGLASAAELLRGGHNVLLYPQATRSAGQIEGFRTGVARLALATDTPLIPIHVGGSAMIMPKGRGLIQRGRTTVAFGRPIFPREDEDPRELIDRVQTAIGALSKSGGASRRRRNRFDP